ncbi:hypothetical protein N7G274_004309 [Stereocaulon virgatum]|uniref:Uncharacterized protein n=1 Tax=Stereocaulon virgatum TaxID=373712 RepID=A0ABR4AEW6_9LECA
MALPTPTRRALVDLPLNSFATHSAARYTGKGLAFHKRRFQEIEDLGFVPPASRLCLSPARLASTIRDERAGEEPRFVMPSINIATPISIPANGLPPHIAAITEDAGEGDSQYTSQQTTATELTQPSPSRVSRHAETLRLRLRLAHFKIQTNQTNIPLSRLRISKTGGEDKILAPSSVLDDQLSLPKLLPAPVLCPTGYSERMIAQSRQPSLRPGSTEGDSGTGDHDAVFRTHALPRHATRLSIQQTSSSPLGRSRGEECNDDDDVKQRLDSWTYDKSAERVSGTHKDC